MYELDIRGKIGIGAGGIIGIILIILTFTNTDVLFPTEDEEFMTRAEFSNPMNSTKINTECELVNFLNDPENMNKVTGLLVANEDLFFEKYYSLGGSLNSSSGPNVIANQDRLGWTAFMEILMEEFLVNPELQHFLMDIKTEPPQNLIKKIKENDPNCDIGEGVLNPNLEQQTQRELSPPENAGPLGDVHMHSGILVKILGDSFDFSAPVFQIKSSWIHFERLDGTTIHKHASGVTLGYLFDTLGIGLDLNCFESPDGRSFCTDEKYSLKFLINGESVNNIRDYNFKEGDRILVSYGAETPKEIEQQSSELYNIELME